MEVDSQSLEVSVWLNDRMRKDPKEDGDLVIELEEILSQINKPEEKKTTKKFSQMIRRKLGSRILHVVVPRVTRWGMRLL